MECVMKMLCNITIHQSHFIMNKARVILWQSHKLFMTEKWLNILLKILRCKHCYI